MAGRNVEGQPVMKGKERRDRRQRKTTHDPNPRTQKTRKVERESILLEKKYGASDDRLPERLEGGKALRILRSPENEEWRWLQAAGKWRNGANYKQPEDEEWRWLLAAKGWRRRTRRRAGDSRRDLGKKNSKGWRSTSWEAEVEQDEEGAGSRRRATRWRGSGFLRPLGPAASQSVLTSCPAPCAKKH